VPEPGSRAFDVVVFGATGFTGALTAAELARRAPEGCRWAIAGRDRRRLEGVRAGLAADRPALAELPIVVADRLRADTVMVFNGDVLSGLDLTALLATHADNDADVTLHLVKVADPRAFGSVPTGADGRVEAFLEKTDSPPTDQINAGCYVFKRSVIQDIPAGRVVSVERETFPGLLAGGARVFGHIDSTYWLDLGTPAAFVRGSADLVTGVAPTAALPGPVGTSLVLDGAEVDASATLTGGSTIGRGVVIGAGVTVDGSVVFDGAKIAAGAEVKRSIVGIGAIVGADAVLSDAVIGDGAVVGDRCELLAGIRVWPGVTVPVAGIRFSAES